MPASASGRDISYDIPLSNFAASCFSDGTGDFIGEMLFPFTSSPKQSDRYYVIDPQSFLRDYSDAAVRAKKTAPKLIDWTVSSDTFFCQNFALGHENALEDLQQADTAVALRQNSTRLVVTALKRAQESRILNAVTSTTNVGSAFALTGAAKWSDFVNSDPMADVTTGQSVILRQTGFLPNVAAMDWGTYSMVRRHPKLLDLFKYTSGGNVKDEELANAFGVDRLLVSKAIKEQSKEGQAVGSKVFMMGNNVLLAYVANQAEVGLQTATYGLRFQWQPDTFPGNFGVSTDVQNKAGQRKVEVIEAGHYQSEKIIGKDMGYLITGTL